MLYLLPRAWTDRTLPLQVSPQPDSVVRVMVGRAELITPSVERESQEQILTFSRGDAKAKAGSLRPCARWDSARFLNAAISESRRRQTDAALSKASWELSEALSAREAERSARSSPSPSRRST